MKLCRLHLVMGAVLALCIGWFSSSSCISADSNPEREYIIAAGYRAPRAKPVIVKCSGNQGIESSDAELWISQINSTGSIIRAYATISAVGQHVDSNVGQIALKWDEGNNLYQGTFDGFASFGEYHAKLYVVDDRDQISDPKLTIISRSGNVPDLYEPDNELDKASILDLTPSIVNLSDPEVTVDDPDYHRYQIHNFHQSDTEDWFRIFLQGGDKSDVRYRVRVTEVEPACNPAIYIYDKDGNGPIWQMDDYVEGKNESLSWSAPNGQDDFYYVRVVQKYRYANGENTGYRIQLDKPYNLQQVPISGVLIPALDAEIKSDLGCAYTSANDQGQFIMHCVQGEQTITVSAKGFEDWTQTLTFEAGKENTIHIELIPLPGAPVVLFGADKTEGVYPLDVSFVDETTGDVAEWRWEFGDGETSSDRNPIHTYTVPGSYSVSLTVSGAGGSNVETKDDYVRAVFTAPSLRKPANSANAVSLNPELATGEVFDSREESVLKATQWQISVSYDLSLVIMDIQTPSTTSLSVPEGITENSSTYYWRARYIDTHEGQSAWSGIYTFTTESGVSNDQNNNGIPDAQEVHAATDLDGNQVSDEGQEDFKLVESVEGGFLLGLKAQTANIQLKSLMSIHSNEIPADLDKPDQLPFGLLKLRVEDSEGTGGRDIKMGWFSSKPLQDQINWYLYDYVKGWEDISASVSMGSYGTSAELTLEGPLSPNDGDQEVDTDNGGPPSARTSDGGGAGGSCFVRILFIGLLMK